MTGNQLPDGWINGFNRRREVSCTYKKKFQFRRESDKNDEMVLCLGSRAAFLQIKLDAVGTVASS